MACNKWYLLIALGSVLKKNKWLYTGHLLTSAEFWALCNIWKSSEHGEERNVLVIKIISLAVLGWVMNDNVFELCNFFCIQVLIFKDFVQTVYRGDCKMSLTFYVMWSSFICRYSISYASLLCPPEFAHACHSFQMSFYVTLWFEILRFYFVSIFKLHTDFTLYNQSIKKISVILSVIKNVMLISWITVT